MEKEIPFGVQLVTDASRLTLHGALEGGGGGATTNISNAIPHSGPRRPQEQWRRRGKLDLRGAFSGRVAESPFGGGVGDRGRWQCGLVEWWDVITLTRGDNFEFSI